MANVTRENFDPEHDAIYILRINDVRARTGLSADRIYRLAAAGKFPQCVRLSVRCVGWIQAEVDQWLRERIEARDKPPNVVARRRRRRHAA